MHNGWSNRETWSVNLWLSNDEGLYRATQDAVHQALRRATDQDTAREELATALADLYDEMIPADLPGPIRDLLRVEQIEWDEIAGSWLSDEEEYQALGAEEAAQ